MPASRPSSSTTHVMPRRLLDISWKTSGIGVDTRHDRRRVAGVHHVLDPHQPAAELAARDGATRTAPRGSPCGRAASSPARRPSPAPRSCSPSGTRFIGQASSAMPQFSVTSAARASVDAGWPVIAMSRAPIRRIDSSSRSSSSVSPLCDSAMHDVVLADRAEIAVDGFGRVQEPGRRAGARERRRNLPADEAGLAHAGDDDAAVAVEEQLDGAFEVAVDAIDEAEDRGRFGPQHLAREIEAGDRVVHTHRHSMRDRRGCRTSRCSSGSSRSSRSAFCASLLACSGSLVHFQEHAVDAGRHARRGQRLDELAPVRR